MLRITQPQASKHLAVLKQVGLVSVRAFDSLVHGIDRWKQANSGGSPTGVGGNTDASRRPDESTVESLHAALGREMDSADKALVRARRES